MGLAARFAWLVERGFPANLAIALFSNICEVADEPEAFAVLLDAMPERQPRSNVKRFVKEACTYRRQGCLQLLLGRGQLCASRKSLPDLLEYATGHTAPVAQRDLSFFLSFTGHTAGADTALWLVEHLTGEGVPEAQWPWLTAEVFAAATRAGSEPLLQLLRERGCPMDAAAWNGAAIGGCRAVLEWLHEAGCPKPVRQQGNACLHLPASSASCTARAALTELLACVPTEIIRNCHVWLTSGRTSALTSAPSTRSCASACRT